MMKAVLYSPFPALITGGDSLSTEVARMLAESMVGKPVTFLGEELGTIVTAELHDAGVRVTVDLADNEMTRVLAEGYSGHSTTFIRTEEDS
jgi:ABC-type histidine transport system ATPase subunit